MRKPKSKVTGYKIDFASNTITLNYKFAAAAAQFNSPEYQLLRDIKKDFPEMTEIIQPGRRITTPRPTKRLTYENMRKHIEVYENSEELLKTFGMVRALSKPLKSPYKYVRDWFEEQFPNYKENPTFEDGKIIAIPVKPRDTLGYEKKDTSTSAAPKVVNS